jgi:hypothetical protein
MGETSGIPTSKGLGFHSPASFGRSKEDISMPVCPAELENLVGGIVRAHSMGFRTYSMG